MNLPLTEEIVTLVKNILDSNSQDEVKRYIHIAKSNLEEKKASAQTVLEYFENTIIHLKELNAFNKSPQEWSNIHTARILLKRATNELNIPVC
jgi:hypothetical protein